MPIHFFKRKCPEEWFCVMVEFYSSNLARSSLNRQFNDAKNPVSMPASVGSVDLHLADLFQFEPLDEFGRKRQLSRTRVNKGFTFYILSPFVLR